MTRTEPAGWAGARAQLPAAARQVADGRHAPVPPSSTAVPRPRTEAALMHAEPARSQQPRHPVQTLTATQLRDYRRELEHALKHLPGRAPVRDLLGRPARRGPRRAGLPRPDRQPARPGHRPVIPGASGPLARSPLRTVPDDAGQLLRLDQFRRDHTGVSIGAGSGWWQALIPEPDGERVITRYTLRELLDTLDQLTATPPGDRSG